MTRRVQMVGYYGMGNYGDDLFRSLMEKNAEHIWPGASVRAWLPRRAGITSNLGRVGQATRLASASVGAAWADTFALCGGSVLHDLSGVQGLRTRLVDRRAFEALGVSVGPFGTDGDKEAVKGFLDHFQRVIVRDEASNERMGEKWRVGGDLAGLLDDLPKRESHSRAVTVCPSHASGIRAYTLASQVFRGLGDTKRPVRLLALNYHSALGDEVLCAQVAHHLRSLGQETVYTLSYRTLGIEGVTAVMARSRAVWTQRLHGGIVSYLLGTPFLVVGHHAKVNDFAQDIGLPDGLTLDPSEEDWSQAIAMTLDGKSFVPSMDPTQYRERARAAYLEGK